MPTALLLWCRASVYVYSTQKYFATFVFASTASEKPRRRLIASRKVQRNGPVQAEILLTLQGMRIWNIQNLKPEANQSVKVCPRVKFSKAIEAVVEIG